MKSIFLTFQLILVIFCELCCSGWIDVVNFVLQTPLFRRACDCKCGVSHPPRHGRLFNGALVSPSEFPWIVSIRKEKGQMAGTLINDLFVLTAASSVYKEPYYKMRVEINKFNYCENNSDSMSFKVISVIVHPDFVPTANIHNLALLKLSSPVPYSPERLPICLPFPGFTYNGLLTTVVTSVWSSKTIVNELQNTDNCFPKRVELPILDKNKCPNRLHYFEDCLGIIGSTSVICGNDVGTGAMYRSPRGQYELIGIISDKQSCSPGENILQSPYDLPIMTSVTSHMDWILKNARDGCFCRRNLFT